MKNQSLKRKMLCIAAIPISLLVIVAFLSLQSSFQTWQESKFVQERLKLVNAASNLAHFTQLERGKSSSFIGGAANINALKSQWDKTNPTLDSFNKILQESNYDLEKKKNFEQSIKIFLDSRQQILNKEMSLKNMLGIYTEFIQSLLGLQVELAKSVSDSDVAASLRSLRILEEAKESGGKLRANSVNILANNKGISDFKYNQLIGLHSGLVEGLKSQGLKLSSENKKIIDDLFTSKEWRDVNSSFILILKNYENGNYNKNSFEFFKIISSMLNQVNLVISNEKTLLNNNVQILKQETQAFFIGVATTAIIILFGVMFFAMRVAKTTEQTVMKIVDFITEESVHLTKSSNSVSKMSLELSESSIQQSSSLQQTVSSINEIGAMTERNAEAAMASKDLSSGADEAATQGMNTVRSMIESIAEISKSNSDIEKEMHYNNENISKIVDVISEIGQKTTVINDIVFQTKLLSFNASVEAARAGEHGKGFAVVAEEIGNLASMSGKAATEITEMLEHSIREVRNIAESTKKNVEELITSSKEKVNLGTKTANKCGESLTEISNNVSQVNLMIQDIARASDEQATGVQEITSAMQKLDEITHRNSSFSQESSQMAMEFKEQAKELDDAINDLKIAILGKGNKSNSIQNSKVSLNVISEEQAKVIAMPERKSEEPAPENLKVSGSDLDVPQFNDPRFK